MSEKPRRDLAPFLHLGAGLILFVGLNAARLFGLFDVGAMGNLILSLFTALIFIAGQPRGRRGWLIAVSAALLAVAAVGGIVPVLRWMADGETSFDPLGAFAAMVICSVAIGILREHSGPGPAHSPTNPKAWKPITRWGVLSGLVLGATVFAVALYFWSRWADAHPEIAVVGGFIVFLQAFLAGALAALTAIWCRPSDRRSALLSVLAGLAVAGLLTASLLGGMALAPIFEPDRRILLVMKDVLLFSAALTIPAIYAATWTLGRRPSAPHQAEGNTP
jgi:hypothetical protein